MKLNETLTMNSTSKNRKKTIILLVLLAMLVVGVFSGLYPVVENRYRIHKVISQVESVGGAVRTRPLEQSDWFSESVRRILPSISSQKVVAVDLHSCNIDSATLDALEACRYLRDLDLSETNVVNDDLRSLRGAMQLSRINLSQTAVGDDGIKWLNSSAPLLRIHLDYTNVTDKVAKHLVAYPKLNTLTVNGTNITDQMLIYLAQSSKPQEPMTLMMYDTKVTPNGIRTLAEHSNELVSLGVSGNKWNDETITVFTGLATLEELSLYNTAVSKTGVWELEKSIPGCKVILLSD